MKPAPFDYRRAGSAEEAVALLSEFGEDAKLVAGGQSLVAMMNFRLARPSALVDVSRIDELRFVTPLDGTLRVGALARHRDLERLDDPQVRRRFSVLPLAARQIGHYVIREAGTFGGSLAHCDPAAEWCMIALLLDAAITVLGPAGRRVVPATRFFHGFLQTDLSHDEMLVEARLSGALPHTGFREFARRHGDFAVVAAAAAFALQDGTVSDARVVLGGVSGTAVRSEGAERVLTGAALGEEVFRAAGEAAASEVDPPADLQGDGDYRRQLVRVLVRRALEDASADVD